MSLVRLAEAGLSEECKMKLIKYSISYQQEKAVFFFLQRNRSQGGGSLLQTGLFFFTTIDLKNLRSIAATAGSSEEKTLIVEDET